MCNNTRRILNNTRRILPFIKTSNMNFRTRVGYWRYKKLLWHVITIVLEVILEKPNIPLFKAICTFLGPLAVSRNFFIIELEFRITLWSNLSVRMEKSLHISSWLILHIIPFYFSIKRISKSITLKISLQERIKE